MFIVKNKQDFYIKNKNKDGLESICKECKIKKTKDPIYQANKKQKLSENRSVVNDYLWNIYSNSKCEHCGISDPLILDFDHIVPEEKSFTISERKDLPVDKLKKEIDKCRILCCNCHQIKSHFQLNTWKAKMIKNSTHNSTANTITYDNFIVDNNDSSTS